MTIHSNGREILYELSHVCRYFHQHAAHQLHALDGIDLVLQKGIYAVISGPSGAGKTTLLAILAGLDRPTSGSVLLEGASLGSMSLAALTRVRQRMGIAYQESSLIGGLSALENVTYALIPRGFPRPERIRMACQVLDQLGLGDRLREPARNLSSGEQQRLSIARAIVGKPEIVLADEPTSNLDAVTGQKVIETLEGCHAAGTTLIISSHDDRIVRRAERVICLNKGRIIPCE